MMIKSIELVRHQVPNDGLLTPYVRQRIGLIVALGVVFTVIALGISFSFPEWDDAWLTLVIKEHGLSALPEAIPDRPLAAFLMGKAVSIGEMPVIIVSTSLWLALGLLTGEILTIYAPQLRGYRPLCILLAVSPILVKVHLVVYNVVPTALLPVVMGYTGFLLLNRYCLKEVKKTFLLIFGLALFATGILISEYILPVSLITVVLLLPHVKNENTRRRGVLAIVLLAIANVAIYPFMAFIARENTSPAFAIENFAATLKKLLFTLFGTIWQSMVSAYVEGLALISNLSLSNRPGYAYLIVGVAVSIPLLFATRKCRNPKLSAATIPFLALIIGIIPICLMSRVPYPGAATRFLLPLIPLSSVLFVFILAKLIRIKYWYVAVILVGLISGASSTDLAMDGMREQARISGYSEKLKALVEHSSGLVIAVVDSGMGDYTLTGKITESWPVDLQKKFWAINEEKAPTQVGERSKCDTSQFNRTIRLVGRSAPVERTILVSRAGEIEDYCIQQP